ncbi:LysR family transcriptional regulator [Staphylococcus epidermidis]|nr:LysR family transcriptional regulator [Staphylococcus epidermidis]
MNFEQLAYVKKLYELESMIQASESIHISQSAMSQSLTNLEKELGYKLFSRSRKGTTLTEAGNRLIPFILEILESKDALLSEIAMMRTNIKGTLRVGTIPTLFHKILPKALSQFKDNHPNVDVEVIEADKDRIKMLVNHGDIDIGLIGVTEREDEDSQVSQHSLNLTSHFRLIVPKKSKLTFKEYVNLEEIQQYPFVLYDREFYQHHLKKFEETHHPLKIIFKTTNPIVLMRTVAEGLGVGIVSALMLENEPFLDNEFIESVTLGKPFDYVVNFIAIVNKEKSKQQIVLEFIHYLKKNE